MPRARMYDTDLGIFYGADPAGQGFAAYAYCGNNPVTRIDKDGKIFALIAMLATSFSAFESIVQNGANIHNGWDFLKYSASGAAVGYLSATAGFTVATSGIPMANTLGAMTTSFLNSTGQSIISGKNSVSVNFGIGTFNSNTGDVRWVFQAPEGGNRCEILDYFQYASDVLGVVDFANDVYALADVDFRDIKTGEDKVTEINKKHGSPSSKTDVYKDARTQISETWKKIGTGTEAYKEIQSVSVHEPLLGKVIHGATNSFRRGRWHAGDFNGQTYLHMDLFDINKNLLLHTLEWLLTPESPKVVLQ